MKTIVLGAGLVGGPMSLDLEQDPSLKVTVADLNEAALRSLKEQAPNLQTEVVDLSQTKNVKSLIQDYDLVLNAVPGFMGYQTLKAIIESGKNVVDIAFCPENTLELDELAKKNNVTAIVDCGVAPGMSNILTGYVYYQMDKTDVALTYVGGLPKVRSWPYEYKAVFSPIDVIEEYTRPARYVENGQHVVRPALSDAELLNFPGIGTLEAFNSDGLRTLADTLDVPNMKEKTLRYIGHIEKMAVLRDSGFFGTEEIQVGDVSIRPMDLTSKLLFKSWKLEKGEADVTVMQVIVEGTQNGKQLRYTYDLLDEYDAKTSVHSMARTTGYTATMALRLLSRGLYSEKGIIAPEFIGKDKACVDFMLAGLAERGVHYKETIDEI
ncbi:MAG: saccharopine dehydrogenase [Deltaproteobacteria bacterium]|mgnify:CR=1 FL=1|jgi:lysine 6-dehydrogenase|nr:saccharopine dehydrogenase [Deltaproteobacteria bacterium]MBT6432594.1 saccharopine dehydrogenase [Deltaproteobacteria bacterium]MBT6491215.1 saccharopine dehydrogenase [Deltaproteobacteria bacterium]